MKNIAMTLLLCAATATAFCQTMPVDKATGLITYTEVVNVTGASQKQLYKAAKLWVLADYSPGYVSQLNDDETSTIVLMPSMRAYQNDDPDMDAGSVRYSLTIECRDGKYRYTFTGFFHQKIPKTNMCDGGNLEKESYDCPSLIMNKKALWADIKKETNDNVLWLVADMKKTIASTWNVSKGDW